MKPNRKILLALLATVFVGLPLSPGRAAPLDLIKSFEAIPNSGWTPCDPIIAAGPASLVTMVNSKMVIFNKQGAKLFEQNLNGAGGFWGAQGASSIVAEPWVIFDPNSDRFIALAADHGSAKGALYLAVSKSPTPVSSSDWHKYVLDRSGTHQGPSFPGVPTCPDNAKVGVDSDAIYITSAHFAKDPNITLNFSHIEIFALAKAPLLSGASLQMPHDEPVITDSYSPHLAFSIHPAIVFGPASAMYFVQSLTRLPDDKIVVHALANVLTAPTRVVSLVPVAPFDRPPNVPQRGSTLLLDNIDARLMSAVVRNGALWTSHGILDPLADAESLVRWYQFDITGLPNTHATLVQSGNVDPGPGIHAWLPHLNVDADGNMGLTFSVGGANQYAAIGYTGRLAGDDAGRTLPVRTARAGAGPYTQGGWGEYSGLAMDPDGYTFWLFHEYPTKQKSWATFAGAFQMGTPPPPPLADPLHSGDLDGSRASQTTTKWRATVAVTMLDGNENVVAGANVSIQWSTGAAATATTDANGQCTFTLGSLSKQNTPSVTLTITGATHATLSYSAAENHDPDGDSNGTSITVNKP